MKIERPKSLTGLVVDELRARILDGRLRLGEALSENVLAADLGISKTPVREALLQLKLERLVDVLPQRGTYVFRLARDEVVMISELREMLELPAAAAAIERNHAALVARMTEIYQDMSKAYKAGDNAGYRARDGELHQAIVDLCDNPYLSNAYNQVGFRIQALRSRLADEMSLNRASYKDHGEMLKLVKARKVEELQSLLRAHIRQTMHSYLEVLGDRDALGEEAAPIGSVPVPGAREEREQCAIASSTARPKRAIRAAFMHWRANFPIRDRSRVLRSEPISLYCRAMTRAETKQNKSSKPARPARVPQGLAARDLAVQLVSDVLLGRQPLDQAWSELTARPAIAALEPRDRALARLIAATVLRRQGELEQVLNAFLAKPLPADKGRLWPILLAGAAQLVCLGMPPHAVVDIAVELAQRDRGAHRFAKLANAVLRRVGERGAGLLADQDGVRLNTPDWLWQRWAAHYGAETARHIAEASLQEAAARPHIEARHRGRGAGLGREARRHVAADRLGAGDSARPHRGPAGLRRRRAGGCRTRRRRWWCASPATSPDARRRPVRGPRRQDGAAGGGGRAGHGGGRVARAPWRVCATTSPACVCRPTWSRPTRPPGRPAARSTS